MTDHKIAKDSDEAWNIQETYDGKPRGWVQWKGTDACIDVHCSCGCHSHIDAMFAYFFECPDCSKIWMLNGHIELIEVLKDPIDCVIRDFSG